MTDPLMPPQPARTGAPLDTDDAACVRDGLVLLAASFDQVGAPGALLRSHLGELAGDDAATMRALRGVLTVASLLVQSLALANAERPEGTLAAVALDVEGLFPPPPGSTGEDVRAAV